MKKVSVVVPVRGFRLVREMLYSLYGGNESVELETIVLHDGEIVEEDGGNIEEIASVVEVVRGGLADGGSLYRLWNEGLKKASGDYIGIVHDDVFFTRGWDVAVCEELKKGKRVVCPLWSYPPGAERKVAEGWAIPVARVKASQVLEAMATFMFRRGQMEDSEIVVYERCGLAGFCFFAQREVFDLVGGFDEAYRLWFGDDDWGKRLGFYSIPVVVPSRFYIWHIQGATTAGLDRKQLEEWREADERLFRSKWEKGGGSSDNG
jgi:GT2 family glycosyltransferase